RETGLLGDAAGGTYGGIPLRVFRSLMQRAESIRLAMVPTTQGIAKLVFLMPRVQEGERRLLAILEPFMRPVDRKFGVAIHALDLNPGPIPWSAPPPSIHVVVLDERLVFCVGPEEALESLLKSRVAGHGQSVRRRAGFDSSAAEDQSDDIWAFLDITVVAEALESIVQELGGDPVSVRANLVETFGTVSARGKVSRSDETMELRVNLRNGAQDFRSTAVASGTHSLLSHIPIAPDMVVSLSVNRPVDLQRLFSAFNESSPGREGDPEALTWNDLAGRLTDSLLPANPAEPGLLSARDVLLALFRDQDEAGDDTEGHGWLLTVKLGSTGQASAVADQVIPLLTLPNQIHGEIHDEEGVLHVVGPSRDQPGTSALAWRTRGDLLLMASDATLLELAGSWVPDTSTSESEVHLKDAMGSQPSGAPLVITVRAPHLRRMTTDLTREPGIVFTRLNRALTHLSPDFTLSLGFGLEGDELVVHSNLGPWSFAAAMASWDAMQFTGVQASAMPTRCRAAYERLCRSTPSLSLCRHFQQASRQVVLDTCQRLLEQYPAEGSSPAVP
ncbi:MAG: hypothetical protein VYE15_02420, partial [Myxococcota bacterium]|nr:hypothetical protein [Myxococcota bacterium]